MKPGAVVDLTHTHIFRMGQGEAMVIRVVASELTKVVSEISGVILPLHLCNVWLHIE